MGSEALHNEVVRAPHDKWLEIFLIVSLLFSLPMQASALGMQGHAAVHAVHESGHALHHSGSDAGVHVFETDVVPVTPEPLTLHPADGCDGACAAGCASACGHLMATAVLPPPLGPAGCPLCTSVDFPLIQEAIEAELRPPRQLLS